MEVKREIWMYVTRGWTKRKGEIRSWRVRGRRADCRSLRSARAGRFPFPFSIIFQLRRSENRKNAADPAFLELDCKLPKLRTWVRFPSPAPEIRKIHVDSAALTHQPSLDLSLWDRGFAPILRPSWQP